MKLYVKNDWEEIRYYFNHVPLDETKDGEVILTSGEKISYKSVKILRSYSDHGHESNVTAYKLKATIEFNGEKIEVDLEQLDIAKILF